MWPEVGHERDCTKPARPLGSFGPPPPAPSPHRSVPLAWQASPQPLDVNKTRLANRKTDSSRTEWRVLPPLPLLPAGWLDEKDSNHAVCSPFHFKELVSRS